MLLASAGQMILDSTPQTFTGATRITRELVGMQTRILRVWDGAQPRLCISNVLRRLPSHRPTLGATEIGSHLRISRGLLHARVWVPPQTI